MKRPSIDNLNRFMRGEKLTTPQRANAIIEFKKLGYYIDSLEASLAKGGETEQPISPFKVRVELRKSQFICKTGEWLCTINGTPRIVSGQVVEWDCTSWEEAVNSFNPSEVEWITIKGNSIHID